VLRLERDLTRDIAKFALYTPNRLAGYEWAAGEAGRWQWLTVFREGAGGRGADVRKGRLGHPAGVADRLPQQSGHRRRGGCSSPVMASTGELQPVAGAERHAHFNLWENFCCRFAAETPKGDWPCNF
jgi:hypothetical protein